ncbi:hypothetical protein JNM05_14430 [bacterium]|nr:hypothetical protein [bacterium]
MKNVIVLFLIVTLNAVEAYSQNSQDEDSVSFHKKRWALQFQVGRDFTLNSFQGSIISLKKTLSEKSALRIGVSFGTGINNDNSKFSHFPPDTAHSERNSDNSGFDLNVSSQYIHYLPIEDHIAGYYGIGPTFGYSFNKNKYKDSNTNGSSTSSSSVSTTTNTWNIGANAVFGVEWFVRNNISLSGEYGVSLSYSNNKQDYKGESSYSSNPSIDFKEQRNWDRFSLGANIVKFGLSVYFE